MRMWSRHGMSESLTRGSRRVMMLAETISILGFGSGSGKIVRILHDQLWLRRLTNDHRSRTRREVPINSCGYEGSLRAPFSPSPLEHPPLITPYTDC